MTFEPAAWLAIATFGVGGMWLAHLARRREVAAIRRGEWRGCTTLEVTGVLWLDYLRGEVNPELLERATSLKPGLLRGEVLNWLVCLDVAAGRYRQALEWRNRWNWTEVGSGYQPSLILINEAEALACLGRLEEALEHVAMANSGFALVRAGRAAHRAWLLAELGRLDEARRELRDHERLSRSLGLFKAEWYFSVFAIDFAARDWVAASAALDKAEQLARRESSRRNVSLLRGRLAFARAAYEDAIQSFDRAAASKYRWQGGAAWLEHGDALAHLGRRDDARAAWRSCLERDGQSPASELARSRLSADP